MRVFTRAVPIAMVALLGLVAPLPAAVQQNVQVPVTQEAFIPCTGETVVTEGVIHLLVTYTVNGNNISGSFHPNLHDVVGTSVPSGVTYRAVAGGDRHYEFSLQNGQSVFNFVGHENFVGQGSAPNLDGAFRMHMTFNADGTVTAQNDSFDLTCK